MVIQSLCLVVAGNCQTEPFQINDEHFANDTANLPWIECNEVAEDGLGAGISLISHCSSHIIWKTVWVKKGKRDESDG